MPLHRLDDCGLTERCHRNDKLRALKYQRMKLRHTLFTIDSKNKKKHDELLEDESDLDDDWIASHEEDLAEKDREKIRKKFEKENEKLVAEGEPAQKQKVLDDRLANVDDNLERLKEERKTQECVARRRFEFFREPALIPFLGSSRSAVRRPTRLWPPSRRWTTASRRIARRPSTRMKARRRLSARRSSTTWTRA